jgi:hypothetical protein
LIINLSNYDSQFGIPVEILDMRQEKAQELRLSMDRAPSMKEEEINELRIDIKVCIDGRITLKPELGQN